MYENNIKNIGDAQNGDKQALEDLINDNSGLIYSIVKRFKDRGYELEDLYQIAVIGFIKSIKRFDTSFDKLSNSYSRFIPAYESSIVGIPTIDACFLWQVENASFTYMLAKLASSLEKFGSFSSSPLWNRRFSRRITSPKFEFFIIPLVFSPIQSSE